VAAAEPPRLTAVFHLADVTGPVLTLAPRLARLAESMDVEVVLPGHGAAERVLGAHARVVSLPFGAVIFPRGPIGAVAAAARLVRDVAVLRRHLRQARPDVVLVVTTVVPAALFAARLGAVPAVVYAAEILHRGHVGGPGRALAARLTAGLVGRSAAAVVAPSEAVAAQFRSRRAEVAVVHPGIAAAYADGRRERLRADGDPGPWLAVVGSLTRGRGQDVAVRALALLRETFPTACLVLAGDPHPRPADRRFAREVRELAAGLGVADAVRFLGHVEEVADVYAAADVVVNPARFNEPFGRAAVEALVAGRPVVASRVGAIPEVLRDGRDALLVPPDDPAALAAAVTRVLQEDDLARELVESGRRRAGEYDEERGVDAFCALVDRVVRRGTG
jgi:glycosyltransferase involved in cell wall biosynthesis